MENLIMLLKLVQVLLVLIMALVLIYIGYMMVSFKNFIPFVPTQKKIAKLMAEKAALKPGEKACDLGSGTGNLVLALARMYPGNEITGFEIAPVLIFVSRLKLFFYFLKNKKIKIVKQDLFTVDLSQFDAVMFFLLPKAIEKLMPALDKMKIGSRIISKTFPLLNADKWQEEPMHLSERNSIFIYTKKI